MTREKKLVREGWVRQTTFDEPRLSEIVRMYEEIGFEVHLEPFHPEEEQVCSLCMKADPDRYQTVYTRKRRDGRKD